MRYNDVHYIIALYYFFEECITRLVQYIDLRHWENFHHETNLDDGFKWVLCTSSTQSLSLSAEEDLAFRNDGLATIVSTNSDVPT